MNNCFKAMRDLTFFGYPGTKFFFGYPGIRLRDMPPLQSPAEAASLIAAVAQGTSSSETKVEVVCIF